MIDIHMFHHTTPHHTTPTHDTTRHATTRHTTQSQSSRRRGYLVPSAPGLHLALVREWTVRRDSDITSPDVPCPVCLPARLRAALGAEARASDGPDTCRRCLSAQYFWTAAFILLVLLVLSVFLALVSISILMIIKLPARSRHVLALPLVKILLARLRLRRTTRPLIASSRHGIGCDMT